MYLLIDSPPKKNNKKKHQKSLEDLLELAVEN